MRNLIIGPAYKSVGAMVEARQVKSSLSTREIRSPGRAKGAAAEGENEPDVVFQLG